MKNKKLRKVNAILEYTVVIMIVVAAMGGINLYLKRNIMARIKAESDRIIQKNQTVPWEASFTWAGSTQDTTYVENKGIKTTQVVTTSYTSTYQPPTPPYVTDHQGSVLHVQDAVSKPPSDSGSSSGGPVNNPRGRQNRDRGRYQNQ